MQARRVRSWFAFQPLPPGNELISSTLAAKPQQGLFEKQVLCWAVQNLASVSHVRVEHLVLRIRPGHGDIAAAQSVLESQRKIRRSKCHQNLDIRIAAQSWLPAIPLVVWGDEAGGQSLHRRMRRIVYRERGRQRRPAIANEYRTQKV